MDESEFVRIQEDHTGRWYKDIPKDELEPDPLMDELQKEINEEIDRQVLEELKKKH